MKLRLCRRLFFLLGVAVLSAVPLSAHATIRTVNALGDHAVGACDVADCTLREAVQASVAGDSIDFAVAGPIVLGGTELGIARSLTITGPPGGITVSGNNASRVFNITTGTVRLINLTISDGVVEGANGADAGATVFGNAEPGAVAQGGGLRNAGELTLTNCNVQANIALGGNGGNGDSATTSESLGANGGSGLGGGIYNAGTLTLIDSSVQGNYAVGGIGGLTYDANVGDSRSGSGGSGYGGGLYNTSGSTLILTGCTLNANHAAGSVGGSGGINAKGGEGGFTVGGGLYSEGVSGVTNCTLTNCTLSGNSAGAGAGGAAGPGASGFDIDGSGGSASGGGIFANFLTLTQCTISSNSAYGGAAGGPSGFEGSADGGGFFSSAFSGPFSNLRNTITAGNSVQGRFPSGPDVKGTVASQGHNLVGKTDDSAGWIASDLTGTSASPLSPQLLPLADNGGPTPTMALSSSSVAIDAGDDAVLSAPLHLTTDQRGYPRKMGLSVDIGAFEFDPPQTSSTLLVTTIQEHDDGTCGTVDCTLLEALNAANAAPDQSTLNFKAGLVGTILNTLRPNGLPITTPVTINGPGARILAVSGNDQSLVFAITGGPVSIAGLTIRNGRVVGAKGANGAPGAQGVSANAGGIFNQATLALTDCTIRDNFALGGNGGFYGGAGGTARGGGIYNTGTLTLRGCTLRDNGARGGDGNTSTAAGGTGGTAQGGGIYSAGTLTLTNCTFSGNRAEGGSGGGHPGGASPGAGGPGRGGGVSSALALTMTGCTFGGNSASGGSGGHGEFEQGDPGAGSGGGLFRDSSAGGTATLNNTLLAGNSATTDGQDVLGTINAGDYNLVQNTSGATLPGTHNVTGADAKVGTLQDNGGPTDTLALLVGSPAIDKGKNFGVSTDQRGQVRPFDQPGIASAAGGDGSDIGAYERQSPTLSINDVSVTEGPAGSLNAVFTVRLVDGPNASVSVHYTTADGTATAGSDYTAAPDTVLTFAAGQTSKLISVPVKGDALDEANETFKVNLSGAANATILDGVGVGTIIDDDPTPRFFIDDVTVTEGDTGQVAATFHLTLSAASGRTVTVTYKTADGTATAGADYVAHPSTTLTFTPGQNSKNIVVQVKGDTLDEANETFKVVLQSASFVAIVDDKGVGSITDNDPLPVLAVSDAPAKAEGNAGTNHNALFVVTLTGATGRTVTVNYATANGTATAGSDYTATTGILTFAPGQTSKTLPIQVLGDAAVEPDETFKVNLSGASFATIADAQGVHIITNDDGSE